MLNTYSYVIPEVIFTIISSVLTAYGFGRFKFKGHDLLFSAMMAMLFLPQVVLNVPQYIMFNNFGWIGSRLYLPLVVPTLFATETYFIFMLIQFLRNVPKDLEEAASIDGCNVMQTLIQIIVPMLMPAIVSCALFKFMWSSNDFMGPLLYVNTPAKYPATIFVKLSMDSDAGFNWNKIPVPTDLCDLCADRLERGREPLCVHQCLSDCMKFGTIEEMAAELAKKPKQVLWAPYEA